jgi:hypothetical protein
MDSSYQNSSLTMFFLSDVSDHISFFSVKSFKGFNFYSIYYMADIFLFYLDWPLDPLIFSYFD